MSPNTQVRPARDPLHTQDAGTRRVLRDATRTLEGCTLKCHLECEVKGGLDPDGRRRAGRGDFKDRVVRQARLVRGRRTADGIPRRAASQPWDLTSRPSASAPLPFPSLLSHVTKKGHAWPPWCSSPRARALQLDCVKAALPLPQRNLYTVPVTRGRATPVGRPGVGGLRGEPF